MNAARETLARSVGNSVTYADASSGVFDCMPTELFAWMILGLLAVVALHEMTHVFIARAHGHPTVCVAVNAVGVAVVFDDTSSRGYWL